MNRAAGVFPLPMSVAGGAAHPVRRSWAALVAPAAERLVQLRCHQGLNELAHTVPDRCLNRIKPAESNQPVLSIPGDPATSSLLSFSMV